jgi:hypothetical protein
MRNKGQYCDDPRQKESQKRAIKNGHAPEFEPVTLQEQHDLNSLAVERAENRPVAACRASVEISALRSLTIRTANIQVNNVAAKPMLAPRAIGRLYRLREPTKLAVIAASTRMHSNPSRKTRTPMSIIVETGLIDLIPRFS